MYFNPDTPAAPIGPVVFSDVSANQCHISWNVPLEDGGAAILHYKVDKKDLSRLR